VLSLGIRVARPTDPSGALMRAALTVVTLVLVLWVVLGRLPAGWTASFGESPALYRPAGLAVVGVAALLIRPFAYAALPGSVVLAWGRIRVRVRGQARVVPVTEIADVVVERRPEPTGEVLLLVLHDGRELDLCPLHWPGAGDVYLAIRRRIGWQGARGRRLGAAPASPPGRVAAVVLPPPEDPSATASVSE
jgi:hypothetical protein